MLSLQKHAVKAATRGLSSLLNRLGSTSLPTGGLGHAAGQAGDARRAKGDEGTNSFTDTNVISIQVNEDTQTDSVLMICYAL